MTAPPISRRAAARLALALPLALAACVGRDEPPRTFAPLTYDYLTKLKLNVAHIDIDDSWTPHITGDQDGNQVAGISPVRPLDTLRKMAEERLIPGGSSGRAVFVIDDASIVATPTDYQGSFAVHLDISTSDGARSGFAQAHVTRTRARNGDEDSAEERATLYEMVRQMMSDMNVEFEYQVRRSLRDYLQTTSPSAPEPAPVEGQDLSPPTPPQQTAPQQPAPPSPSPQ
jgi:hypothetical protein